MKYIKVIFFWGILWILLALAVWIWCSPQREFSENENRVLQEMPGFSLGDYLGGDLQKNLESGLKDQFPARDLFMQIGTSLKKLTGRRVIGDTYLGSDGRYFERVTDEDIKGSRYEKNLNALEKLAGTYPNLRYSALLVPAAGVVYSEDLPSHASLYDYPSLTRKAQELLASYQLVDVLDYMTQEDLYYRTDHHWTLRGAQKAYECWRQEYLGKKADENYLYETVTESFYGSLYSRTLDPAAQAESIDILQNVPKVTVLADGKDMALYDYDALKKKDKYQVYLGGNYGLVDITGGEGEGSVVILKDSFANCFVPFLLKDYERIIMVDLRYYPGRLGNILQDSDVKDVLILYEMGNFAMDSNLAKLSIQK